jgi:hypothetical protein
MPGLGVRWTIGDVSERGFDALALSIRGMTALLGDRADYVVCVNTVPIDTARRRLGAQADAVRFVQADALAPAFLVERFDDAFAEGVGWKFAPPRIFPDRHELALDNDCILWALPDAIARWLASDDGFLLAEDVVPAFGRFAAHCPTPPRNTGIRGLPPGFDLARALVATLDRVDERLSSELDEQGLQVAALSRDRTPEVVGVDDVSICSPFPPHLPDLGRCGVHFVGLNARSLPWSRGGRSADAWIRDHFDALKDDVDERIEALERDADGIATPV